VKPAMGYEFRPVELVMDTLEEKSNSEACSAAAA